MKNVMYVVLCHGNANSFGGYRTYAEAKEKADRYAYLGTYIKTVYC